MIDSSGNEVTPEDQVIIEQFAIFLRTRREFRETVAKHGKDSPEANELREQLRAMLLKFEAPDEDSSDGTNPS